MQDRSVRAGGLLVAIAYGALIVWLYVSQPQTMAEVTGGLSATVGAYRIDQAAFDEGLALFGQDRHEEARAAFERADPARRDARTQFYIGYSYYRSGWGRFYSDDEQFKLGLERVDAAIALAPDGRLILGGADMRDTHIRSADELRAELVAGLRNDASDLNPMRVFRTRK